MNKSDNSKMITKAKKLLSSFTHPTKVLSTVVAISAFTALATGIASHLSPSHATVTDTGTDNGFSLTLTIGGAQGACVSGGTLYSNNLDIDFGDTATRRLAFPPLVLT